MLSALARLPSLWVPYAANLWGQGIAWRHVSSRGIAYSTGRACFHWLHSRAADCCRGTVREIGKPRCGVHWGVRATCGAGRKLGCAKEATLGRGVLVRATTYHILQLRRCGRGRGNVGLFWGRLCHQFWGGPPLVHRVMRLSYGTPLQRWKGELLVIPLQAHTLAISTIDAHVPPLPPPLLFPGPHLPMMYRIIRVSPHVSGRLPQVHLHAPGGLLHLTPNSLLLLLLLSAIIRRSARPRAFRTCAQRKVHVVAGLLRDCGNARGSSVVVFMVIRGG